MRCCDECPLLPFIPTLLYWTYANDDKGTNVSPSSKPKWHNIIRPVCE